MRCAHGLSPLAHLVVSPCNRGLSAHFRATATAHAQAVERCEHDTYGIVRAVCFNSLCKFLQILRRSGWRVNPEDIASAVQWGQRFLNSYQWLASQATKRGLLLWPTPPKFHVLWHVVRDLPLLPNPVHIQNDKEESFLGILKLFARQCSRLRHASERGRGVACMCLRGQASQASLQASRHARGGAQGAHGSRTSIKHTLPHTARHEAMGAPWCGAPWTGTSWLWACAWPAPSAEAPR